MASGRILVVDDEVSICRTLSSVLSDEGYDVDVGGGVPGDHAEQCALPHSGTCHDADTLSLSQGEAGVDGPHAHVHRGVDSRPVHGVQRVCIQGIPFFGNRSRHAVL